MTDPAARLETMRDMFLYAQNLNSWCVDRDFKLIYSNCPSQQLYYELFSVSYSSGMLAKHIAESELPCIINDSIGFVWIATTEMEGEERGNIHMLGPIFTMEATEQYLYSAFSRLHLSEALLSGLRRQLSVVAMIPLPTAVSYAIMLHYCVTGNRIESKDVTFYSEAMDQNLETSWGDTNWHGTWETEREFFGMLSAGKEINMEAFAAGFARGNVGRMCPGDPLRQAKDEVIIFSTLASRAAIQGGVSAEGGYNLADYYIQRTESCTNVSAVYACATEMFQAVQERIRRSKVNSSIYSSSVAACMEYVETHICEKISLEEMAKSIGYTGYYLSSKFQKETGLSFTAYVKKMKVERAKEYMAKSNLSTADISERLAFSSPSYFTSVFRKETGMTPTEYLKQNPRKE